MEIQLADTVSRVQRHQVPTAGAPDRATVSRALASVYAGPAWHGPSVRDALRGVDARMAASRPAPDRHTIWELVLHLAYTRHRVLLRMGEGERRFPHPLRGAWWPQPPSDVDERAWRDALALLGAYHHRLLDVVRRAPRTALRRVRPGRRETIAHELLGVAFHDAYHAGQIRMLALLQKTGATGNA